jgi:hypothetical protein
VETEWQETSSVRLASALRAVATRVVRRAGERSLWQTLLFFFAILALSFGPIATHDGWPVNHDLLFWKYRLLVYVEHFRRFDLFPIWSESAALGIGAPAPILYHKLFYFFASAFYLLSGSVKVAILGALAGFSVAGVLGLQALFCFVGVKPRAALVAGAALLFCNYTYTDWVVRGAFAEHSAMMLLPWLFRWLFGVLSGETPRRLLHMGALTFPALYLAHATLFYFAAAPVLAAVAWRLVRDSDRKRFLVALLGIAGTFALVSAPIVVCQMLLTPELNFKEGLIIFAPKDNFSSLERHLTGGDYRWGRNSEGYSVQLDMPLVVIAGVALAWVSKAHLWPRLKRFRSPAQGDRDTPPWLGGYLACWLCLPYFAFLLSSASNAVYVHVPGFWALQFPWRLLTFVSVLSVILAAVPLVGVVRLGSLGAGTAFAWVLLGVTYVSSPWLHAIEYAWIPGPMLEAPLSPNAMLHVGGSEYHPKVPGKSGVALIEYLYALRPAADASHWSGPGYTVQRVDTPAFEKGSRTYRVHAERASVVVLPIAYSSFIRVVQVVRGERTRVPTFKQRVDPRIHIGVAAGAVDLEVHFPTLVSLYSDLISDAWAGALRSKSRRRIDAPGDDATGSG